MNLFPHPSKQISSLNYRAAILLGLLLGSLAVIPVTPQTIQSLPALRVDAPTQAAVGEIINLTLRVEEVADIGGYEATLLFDTAAAEFAGVQQRENDLKQLGRDVGSLAVVDLPTGVAFGLYSCPMDDCVTRQGAKKSTGGSGSVELAKVSLIANTPGQLEIKLAAAKFVDAAGKPITVAVPQPAVVIQVGAPDVQIAASSDYQSPADIWTLSTKSPTSPRSFDLTGDGLVTHADTMEVAIEWVRSRQSLTPCNLKAGEIDLTRDINRDGCIDVSDLQMVAARYSASTAKAANSPHRASLASAPNADLTFTVNVVSDGDDANIGNGVCATAYNVCSLRAAIQEANANAGPDTIHFNIGGGGLKTIQLKSKLPTLNDATGPTTIDGYTQPGAAPNTDPVVSNAAIKIQIAGNGEDRHEGFVITSAGNIIRGLALYRLKRAVWLFGQGAAYNVFTGNFIGTNAEGTYGAAALVTAAHGFQIEAGANRNTIGGPALAERNVISGNAQTGVAIWHETGDANVILNNLVGLNPAGTNRLPNRRHAVDLNYGAEANVIGGAGAGERNVLSGNDYSGVEVSHTPATMLNQVIGNFIGTDAIGENAPTWSYNGYTGITLEDGVSNNIIADNVVGNNQQGGIQLTGLETQSNQVYNNWIGVSPNSNPISNWLFGIRVDGRNNVIGPNNRIAYNLYNGVILREDDKDFNRITLNSIYNNGLLGIELLPNDVTPNDEGDVDTGPNENLNFPVLETASTLQVTGTACSGCGVEVFITDNSGDLYGEGKTFAGSATADGNGVFVASLSGVVPGDTITATATDGAGNTSEFSLNLLVEY